MQVIPKYAAASPIDVPNVETAEPNIHAGTKMLRQIEDTYFTDGKLDALNKTLFTLASYNAGPNRIASLRKRAASEGLNPDEWFGNVEFIVAREIGQETVRYVSNIYKYYVAYRVILEQSEQRRREVHAPIADARVRHWGMDYLPSAEGPRARLNDGWPFCGTIRK